MSAPTDRAYQRQTIDGGAGKPLELIAVTLRAGTVIINPDGTATALWRCAGGPDHSLHSSYDAAGCQWPRLAAKSPQRGRSSGGCRLKASPEI
jgi:hypothetical protein